MKKRHFYGMKIIHTCIEAEEMILKETKGLN